MNKTVMFHLATLVTLGAMFLCGLTGDAAGTVSALGTWLILKEYQK